MNSRLLTGLICLSLASPVFAQPEGGEVRAGSATIGQTLGTTTVRQLTDRAIIDWQRFNIDPNELVRFVQPSQMAVILNRVTGNDPSLILGQLKANGQVFLVNPNGILFGPGSQVDVGGLVASTLSISNQDFLAGNYRFTQDGSFDLASVVNQGEIRVTDRGYVVLTAPLVSNEGLIVANLGHVALGAGNQVTLNLDGRRLVSFQLDAAPSEGGTVVLTPEAVSNVLGQVVNDGDLVPSGALVEEGGEVRLVGAEGALVQAGTIESGDVTLDASQVSVLGVASQTAATRKARVLGQNVDVSGAVSGGDVFIGGGLKGQGPERNALTTRVQATSTISADAGTLVVWSDEYTEMAGSLSAPGGFVETSSKKDILLTGEVTAADEWLVDPANITIATTTGTNQIDNDTINTALNNGTNFTVDAAGAAGGEAGNIVQNAGANILKINGGPSTLTLLAGTNGSITLNGTMTAADEPLNVVLTAGTGAGGNVQVAGTINTNGGDFTSTGGGTFSNTASIATVSGDLTVTHAGNVTVFPVSGTNVQLTSTGGSLIPANQTAAEVATPGTVVLSAATAIGSLGTAFEVDTLSVEATVTGTGDIYLSNRGSLGNVNTRLTTANGNIDMRTTSGDLSIINATAGAGGDVTLHSAFDMEIGFINAQGDNVTLTTERGAINERGSDTSSDITASNLVISTCAVAWDGFDGGVGLTGPLEINAATMSVTNRDASSVQTTQIDDINGGLNVVFFESWGGHSNISSVGNLTLTDVHRGGGSSPTFEGRTVGSGNILVNSINMPDLTSSVTLNSVGSIRESGTDASSDITTTTANLTAVGTIGIASNLLDVNVTTLNLNTTGTNGAIYASDTATGVLVNASTVDGNITLNAIGGNLECLDVNAGGSVRNVVLTTTTSGDIGLGSVTALGDQVRATSAAGIREYNADAPVDVTAKVLNFVSASGVGSANALETDATTLQAATVSGTGGIQISDVAGGLVVTNATTFSGSINLTAANGSLTLNLVNAGGTSRTINATTTGAGSHIRVGNVQALGDTITLISSAQIIENGNDAAADLQAVTLQLTSLSQIGTATAALEVDCNDLRATVTGTGGINILDPNTVLVTTAVTNNGAITLAAQNGTLTLTNVDAGNAGVTIDHGGGGNVVVNVVNADGDISITTPTAITEPGGDPGADIVTPGLVTLSAVTGIGGSSAPIEINAGRLNATVSGTGPIDLSDTAGGLIVDQATTTDGYIRIIAVGGNLTSNVINAGGSGADVTLTTTTSGNILIDFVSGTGNVVVTSAGSVLETGVDAGNDFLAGLASEIRANGGNVSATEALEVFVSGTLSVFASTPSGGVGVRLMGTVSPTNALIKLSGTQGTTLLNGVTQ